MNQNTNIYIILNFLLLILFIDVYISYNVKNLNQENFSVYEPSGKNLVCLINKLCNLNNISYKIDIPARFSKDLLNVVNYIISKNKDSIEAYFRKVDPFEDINNISKLYVDKKNILTNMKMNIDRLKDTYNKNKSDNILDNYKDDVDGFLDDDKIIKFAETNIFNNNRIKNITMNYGNKNSLIDKSLNDLAKNKNSCQNINKFLIIFYIKYFIA